MAKGLCRLAMPLAAEVALEHVAWARAHGYRPEQILRALGWLVPMAPTWEHAAFAIEREWPFLRRVE